MSSKEELERIDKALAKILKARLKASREVITSSNNLVSLERELRYIFDNYFNDDSRQFADVFYNSVLCVCNSYSYVNDDNNNVIVKKVINALRETFKSFPDNEKVVCQGVEGAYSQIAADKLFKVSKLLFAKNFEDVFLAINNNEARYGVIPIENSTAGSVTKVYDLMMKYNFSIVRSVRLKVDHNLLVKPGTKISDIKTITSHPQAIAQCASFLSKYPNINVVPCENTAVAAKKVSESEDNSIASISSSSSASLYKLESLFEAIQDEGNNHTRFICISKELEIYPGANRTSVMLSIPHKPGALYNVISYINSFGTNMTKLESRPIPNRDFEFMFYFDLETDVYSPNFIKLLNGLHSMCDTLRYLGSYSEII